MDVELVTFGKYRGKPVQILLDDPSYLHWCMKQPNLMSIIRKYNLFDQEENLFKPKEEVVKTTMTPQDLLTALEQRVQELTTATVAELENRMKDLHLRGKIPIRSMVLKNKVPGFPAANVNIYKDYFTTIQKVVKHKLGVRGFHVELDSHGMFVTYVVSARNEWFLYFLLGLFIFLVTGLAMYR